MRQKTITISVATVASILSLLFSRWLFVAGSFDWLTITAIIIFVLLTVAANAVLFIFTSHKTAWLLAGIPALAAILIGFFRLEGFIAGIILVGLLLPAQQHAARITQNLIKPKLTAYYRPIRTIVTAYALAIATLALGALGTFWERVPQVSEAYILSVTSPVEPVLSNIVPGFQVSQTIDELIADTVSQDGLDINSLDAAALANLRGQVAEQFGQDSVSGTQTFASLIAEKINFAINDLNQNYPWVFGIVIVLALFLTIRAVVPIIAWLIIPLGMLALKALEQSGAVNKVATQVTATRIEL